MEWLDEVKPLNREDVFIMFPDCDGDLAVLKRLRETVGRRVLSEKVTGDPHMATYDVCGGSWNTSFASAPGWHEAMRALRAQKGLVFFKQG